MEISRVRRRISIQHIHIIRTKNLLIITGGNGNPGGVTLKKNYKRNNLHNLLVLLLLLLLLQLLRLLRLLLLLHNQQELQHQSLKVWKRRSKNQKQRTKDYKQRSKDYKQRSKNQKQRTKDYKQRSKDYRNKQRDQLNNNNKIQYVSNYEKAYRSFHWMVSLLELFIFLMKVARNNKFFPLFYPLPHHIKT